MLLELFTKISLIVIILTLGGDIMRNYVKPIIAKDANLHCEGILLESGDEDNPTDPTEIFVCPKQTKRYKYESDNKFWGIDKPCNT